MENFSNGYLDATVKAIHNFKAFDSQKNEIDYKDAIRLVVSQILDIQSSSGKILFAGNGGSAGITSHLALDFWKNGKVKALAFNDPSLLTALGNDIGYEYVFSKPIEVFGEENDVVFAISSSGNSQNILNAAKMGKQRKCFVVTLSGFSLDNKLIGLGDINFYVDSSSYGIVEVLHTLIIHNVLDQKLYEADKINIYNKNLPL